MGHSKQFSSLNCQLRTIKAKNIDFLSTGNIFVRYHLPLGNGQRIQLNSREISAKSELHWNETFSLDCHGSQESLHRLEQENLVLELRWRHTTSVLRKLSSSQLLGRAEIPWKIIFQSPNMEMEKMVTLVSTCKLVPKDVKPPVIQVAMKLKSDPAIVGSVGKNNKEWDECGCKNIGCSCSGYEMFALGSALHEGL